MAKARRGKRSSAFSWAGALRPHGLALVAYVFLGLALLPRLERFVWLGALAAEVAFQLSLTALLLALVAGARRAWPALGALLLGALLLAMPLAPQLRGKRPTPPTGPTLRLLVAHVNGAELRPATLLTELVSGRIDVAAISAQSDAAFARLDVPLPGFRLVRGNQEHGPSLLAVSERWQHKAPRRGVRTPGAFDSILVGRCELELAALNLPSAFSYAARDPRARAIAALERTSPSSRTVWLGHLGSRAGAADLAPVFSARDLRDGRSGHGRLPTAPAALGPLGFPTEHVLVHGWVRVPVLSTESPLVPGAHRSLRATIELTEARCRDTKT